MSDEQKAICRLCGEPMPEGEEMFKFHGYSGDCPKPSSKPTEHVNPKTTQNYQLDRYGLALMMIREGCADPAGFARRVLAEFDGSPSEG